MIINRDNYQIWITDHFDGSLNGDQEEMLFQFLDQNPDLKEEFDHYGHPVVFPDISSGINKEPLKKDINQLTEGQKEFLLVALTEGDLSEEDSSELTDYINGDSFLAEKFNTIRNIRLTVPEIIFPYKIRLKRIPISNPVRRIAVTILSVAAAAALLVSSWIIMQNNRPLEYSSSAVALTAPASQEVFTDEVVSHETLSVGIAETSPGQELNQPLRITHLSDLFTNNENQQPDESNIALREVVIIQPARMSGNIDLVLPGSYSLLSEMTPVVVNEALRASSPREFIAKNIRKLILKDVAAGTDRLKVYEIADVTLIGVNKALGWDMRLDRVTDSDGNINSLKFTSQLIRFDHKMNNNTDGL